MNGPSDFITIYFGAFFATLVASYCLTWYVRRWANARGLVSSPSIRDVHQAPVPRLGGIAVYVTFTICCAIFAVLNRLGVSLPFETDYAVFLLLPGTMIFAVGIYDDLHGASPYTKLAIQIAASLLLFASGFRVMHLSLLPGLFGASHLSTIISFGLTALWITLITNAFNLIDGLDGLAAGSALFSTLTIFVLSILNDSGVVALLAAVLAGTLFGFLRYNFSPATIFLGDSGSMFLGFILGALSLGGLKAPTIIAVAIPVVSLGLPLVETALSVLRRLISGRPLFSADREHIHHKLLDKGLSQSQVVALMYGLSAAFGLLSLILVYPSGRIVGLILGVLAVGVWMALQKLGYQELTEIQRVAHRTFEQMAVMRNNLAIRRAAGRLETARDIAELRQILLDCFSENDFDGFYLSLSRDGSQRLSELTLNWPSANLGNSDSDMGCSWTRSAVDVEPNYTLVLHLRTPEQRSLGCLALYRGQRSHPLLVDVNVLGLEFQSQLADAVRRITTAEGAVAIATSAAIAGQHSG